MAKKENNYYFESFEKSIAFSRDAAALLKEIFASYDEATLNARLSQMHVIEHTADGVKHEVMRRLVKEFLPPIEREDIVELADVIDGVTDTIEDVLRRMYMYNVKTLRPDMMEFADIILKCCTVLTEAAKELPNFRKSETLRAKIIEINGLEEEGDRLYTEAVRRLYTEDISAKDVLVWTTIYDHLEQCCDACEHVADGVEQIVMKNS